ncbi:MAG: hypothetical protein K6E86_04535 [Bacteroidales bacterium]|nr:hypothetical protein [Bacteroidales bacterium]
MARVSPIGIVARMSGKICGHSDMYFSTNKQTGHVYTGKRCFPSEAAPTEAQLAARTRFGQLMGQVKQWVNENGPSTKNVNGTEIYQKVLAAYKAQHRIGNFRAFVSSKFKDGTVTIGDTTGGSGSGSGSGGSTGGGDLG